MPPAFVRTAPYTDRSARVVCAECSIDDHYDRTASAQAAASAHNAEQHPPRRPTEPEPR